MLELNNKRMCPLCFTEVKSGANTCPVCGKVNELNTIPQVLPCGTILHGRYVLGKTLGKGGFSITYLAYDSKTDSVVAVKEFFPSGIAKRDRNQLYVTTQSDSDINFFKQNMKHFYEEAQILSSLQHPNIVNIYKLFSENGTVYYTMEYLNGYDLRHMLTYRGGKLNEQELVPIIACVSEALQTVHDKGLLHRDIAPDNIFITNDGSVKLIDFGAAKDIGNNNQKSFSIILKQGFAPLEQYQRRGNQGPWTDIYALGATMYYCLNGSMPLFAADRISNPDININCSKQLEAVIGKMMEINIENRYKSIKEFKSHFLSAVNNINT
ncbi:MAG: serine/threonine protein kinase, partial [Ruminococcus sp.]|nr:serine/threonine protein kinase [Candidatus Copronaster equi]